MEILINKISLLRNYSFATIAVGIRNSIAIDPEYAIMFAWHSRNHRKISERAYSTVENNMCKVTDKVIINESIIKQLEQCYKNKISLLSEGWKY